ncbi:MAG: diguanylate cyclase [Gemmatimonadaceae bacterium]|nr:diguanylate cyclase [Gemmatimonadaceae bacterium]MCW5826396.1 diguanylate cyclase [Gemmatimonadaceae bacterium]
MLPPRTVPNDALSRAIRVSQAVNRVRQLPTVFIASPLLAAFLAIAYWDVADHTSLIVFTAVMTVLWTPAALSWRRLRKRPRPTDVSPQNEMRALVFSTVTGVLWAVAAWVLYPVGGAEEKAMLVMMMSGLCAGSVAFFSSSPAASIAFFTPFMSSLMVQVVRYDSGAQPILPSAVGVFILCALLFTRTSWHQFVENVQVLVERDEALSAASTNRGQLEATLAQMQDLAMVDQLTGLKNRRAFFDDAETAIAASRRRDQPVSVAVLDLDHFKAVNDTHGHAAGDVVLREAAQRIADSVREEVLVGRYGGEEFVMLLPFTTPAQALVALERIRKAVSQDPIVVPDGGPIVQLTLSAGIASLDEGMPIPVAIDRADKAMYRAKNLGRDRVEVYAG